MKSHKMIWGVAISAAQTESASDIGGKGPSIWDEFCERNSKFWSLKPRIKNKDHLKDSCDFYTHYKSDIDIVKKIGFKHFRFSIAWSRIMPDGIHVNPEGVAFYHQVINYCIEQGIQPWVTLYHWDLPLALEKNGGWTNRKILSDFEQYAIFCAREFQQVKHWMILNEPSVFLGAGYLFGIHAPGKRGFDQFLKATHHALLCVGRAYRAIKSEFPDHTVGSTFSFTHIEPINSKDKHIKAGDTADQLINRFFFEPIIGLGYPNSGFSRLKQINKYIQPGDMEAMRVKLDFIGVQTYTREVFKHNPWNPFLKIKHVPAFDRTIDLTAMNWEMHSESIYHVLKKIHRYGLQIPIYITENGAAFNDKIVLERVNDFARIHYFQTHINEVYRAKQEGVDVRGYFAWSLLDNFEWAEGYYPRFGIVYVDFKTKQRILKESAYWFKSFLKDDI